MEYTMGIDLGTSSVKVVLLSRSGKISETVSNKYGIDIPALGWAEQDPEEWWAATKAAVQEVLRICGVTGSQVKGIGFSGQMHRRRWLSQWQTGAGAGNYWKNWA